MPARFRRGGRRLVTEPFPCRLRAEPDGALHACYFDDASDNERLWVAVRAADARVVAFRDDGAELSLGVDDAPNCLEIDEVRLRHAAAAVEPWLDTSTLDPDTIRHHPTLRHQCQSTLDRHSARHSDTSV